MSLSESLTELVTNFAEKWNVSPFEILEKDVDDFFLIVNSLIRANNRKTETHKAVKKNDGFFDM